MPLPPKRPSTRAAVARLASRAFTLVELMVVVVLIGVLTVMAIPSMAEARYNARTMDDATEIAELFREARTRAIGRGAAQLIQMSADASVASATFPGVSANLGTYVLYEAQSPTPGTATGTADGGGTALLLPGGSPLSSCGSPTTSWTAIIAANATTPTTLIDSVNLNRTAEQTALIWSALNDSSSSPPSAASLCYTPLGRTYYNTTPNFTPGVNLLLGELQISVYRSNVGGAATGLTRTVVIPNSGATRIVSQ